MIFKHRKGKEGEKVLRCYNNRLLDRFTTMPNCRWHQNTIGRMLFNFIPGLENQSVGIYLHLSAIHHRVFLHLTIENILHVFRRRVMYLEWHPTAENILLSAGYDHTIIVWNIAKGQAVNIIDCHEDTIYSMSFNRWTNMINPSNDRFRVVLDLANMHTYILYLSTSISHQPAITKFNPAQL